MPGAKIIPGELAELKARKTYYEILVVRENADKPEIKTAFHMLALKWHTDHNREMFQDAQEGFTLIAEAFDTLYNAEARKKYDGWLAERRRRQQTISIEEYKYDGTGVSSSAGASGSSTQFNGAAQAGDFYMGATGPDPFADVFAFFRELFAAAAASGVPDDMDGPGIEQLFENMEAGRSPFQGRPTTEPGFTRFPRGMPSDPQGAGGFGFASSGSGFGDVNDFKSGGKLRGTTSQGGMPAAFGRGGPGFWGGKAYGAAAADGMNNERPQVYSERPRARHEPQAEAAAAADGINYERTRARYVPRAEAEAAAAGCTDEFESGHYRETAAGAAGDSQGDFSQTFGEDYSAADSGAADPIIVDRCRQQIAHFKRAIEMIKKYIDERQNDEYMQPKIDALKDLRFRLNLGVDSLSEFVERGGIQAPNVSLASIIDTWKSARLSGQTKTNALLIHEHHYFGIGKTKTEEFIERLLTIDTAAQTATASAPTSSDSSTTTYEPSAGFNILR